MKPTSMPPRILLVEDDPTTCAFLTAAVETLPAQVDAVGSLAEARARVDLHDYALWLVDAHLPDGDGAALLAELRARGLHTPALAHTAARERDVADSLLAAGFLAALVKPLSTAELHAAVRDALGTTRLRVVEAGDDTAGGRAGISTTTSAKTPASIPVWDDAAALTALHGQRTHVDALRSLFLDELPAARDAVAAAVHDDDDAALRAALHKLQASCGFVGAARLGAVVDAMRQSPHPHATLPGFIAAAQETLAD